MTCPECGLEMMIYRATTAADGTEDTVKDAWITHPGVCRNKRCGRYDRRLTRKAAVEVPEEEASLV